MGIRALRFLAFTAAVATVICGVATLWSDDGALAGTAVSLAAISSALTVLVLTLQRRQATSARSGRDGEQSTSGQEGVRSDERYRSDTAR